MRKIYYIIFSLLLIFFIYWGATELYTAIPKLAYSYGYILSDTSSSSYGTSLFKSTPEKPALVNTMLQIHYDFTNNPDVLYEKPKDTVENFYKMENLFPSFNSYYVTKLKLSNTIYNELPNLYNNTFNLSNDELNTFFENNTEYLERNWGINSFSEFTNVIDSIQSKNGLKVKSCELEESYFYLPSSNTLKFRIIITLENDLTLYLGVSICYDEISDYQTYPVVRFLGT